MGTMNCIHGIHIDRPCAKCAEATDTAPRPSLARRKVTAAQRRAEEAMRQPSPGPWISVSRHPFDPGTIMAPNPDAPPGKFHRIADVAGTGPVAVANARLMAAAPELLAVAKGLLALLNQGGVPRSDELPSGWPSTAAGLIGQIERGEP